MDNRLKPQFPLVSRSGSGEFLSHTFLSLTVLWILTVTCSAQCPDDCECSDSNRTVTCPLSRMPSTLLPEVSTLKCRRSNDTESGEILPNDTFTQYVEYETLQTIDLSSCGIRHIQPNTFTGLHSVRVIHLDSNLLTRIPEEAFRGVNLDRLSINDNHNLVEVDQAAFAGSRTRELEIKLSGIQTLHVMLFSQMTGPLTRLDVSGASSTLELPSGIFSGLDNNFNLIIQNSSLASLDFLDGLDLETLDLGSSGLADNDWEKLNSLTSVRTLIVSGNNFTVINITKAFPDLGVLDVSRNHIRSLEHTDFTNLQSLNALLMSNNELQALPPSMGEALQQLVVLDVSNNSLSTLQPETLNQLSSRLHTLDVQNNSIQILPSELGPRFRQLTALKLQGNPFHCNCQMLWLWEWVKDLSFGDVDAVLGNCHTPEPKVITQMRPSDFRCSPPLVTFSIGGNFRDGGWLRLRCTSQGDPAPAMLILGPDLENAGAVPEWVTLGNSTPPADRSITENNLDITLQDFNCSQHATFTCVTSNLEGTKNATDSVNQSLCEEITTEIPSPPTEPTEPSPANATTSAPEETGNTGDPEESGYLIPLIVCIALVVVLVLCVAVIMYVRRTKQKYTVQNRDSHDNPHLSVGYNNSAFDDRNVDIRDNPSDRTKT